MTPILVYSRSLAGNRGLATYGQNLRQAVLSSDLNTIPPFLLAAVQNGPSIKIRARSL